jgi:hypothetical protein
VDIISFGIKPPVLVGIATATPKSREMVRLAYPNRPVAALQLRNAAAFTLHRV